MAKQTEREAKLEALKKVMADSNKKYGANSLGRLGEKPETKVETFSTGSLMVDIALGVGGLPRGRIVEIYGPESSGKTTLALHAIASAQQKGGIAAFIDAEHALDPEYAVNLGVDIDELMFSQPSSGEEGLNQVEMLANSNAVDLIVVDSVAALTPAAELKGEIGDSHVGLQARMMSQALRKITAAVSQSKTTIIFINQLREKVGVMFGSPEVTTGGKALKFYASVRLDVRRTGSAKNSAGEITSNQTKIKVVKNKVAPPFKVAETDIFYGRGFVREKEILNLAVEHGIVKKSGSWFSYQGEQLGQGEDKTREKLENNSELADELEAKIWEILNSEREEARSKNEERLKRMVEKRTGLPEVQGNIEQPEGEAPED